MKYSWLKSAPICQKGLFDNNQIYENTLSAIEKAIDCGYNLFLDLALTKDNKLVVCDSKKSSALLASGKKIDNVTTDDMENLKIANSEQSVPLLSEVLSAVAGKTGIIFKISASNNYKKVLICLFKELASYKGKTAIVATNYPIFFWVRKKNKNLACGLILKKSSSKLIYNAILWANIYFFKLIRPHFIVCNVTNLPNRYIDDFLAYCPYSYIISRTITDRESLLAALNYSDNYIFENYQPKK